MHTHSEMPHALATVYLFARNAMNALLVGLSWQKYYSATLIYIPYPTNKIYTFCIKYIYS